MNHEELKNILGDNYKQIIVEKIAESFTSDGFFNDKFDDDLFAYKKMKIDEKVNEIGKKYIDPKINEIIETLIIQETNKYGEKLGTPKTLIEYVTSIAEARLKEEVDLDGLSLNEFKLKHKGDGYGWRKYSDRVTFSIYNYLQSTINDAIKNMIINIDKVVVGGLQKAFETAISDFKSKISITLGK